MATVNVTCLLRMLGTLTHYQVGGIREGPVAKQCIDDGLDIVAIGRGFQKNPGLLFQFADELGIDVRMPNQISWAFRGRGSK